MSSLIVMGGVVIGCRHTSGEVAARFVINRPRFDLFVQWPHCGQLSGTIRDYFFRRKVPVIALHIDACGNFQSPPLFWDKCRFLIPSEALRQEMVHSVQLTRFNLVSLPCILSLHPSLPLSISPPLCSPFDTSLTLIPHSPRVFNLSSPRGLCSDRHHYALPLPFSLSLSPLVLSTLVHLPAHIWPLQTSPLLLLYCKAQVFQINAGFALECSV